MLTQTVVVFGLPGAGKTFVSQILQNNFGYYFHDGDQELPQTMKHALQIEAMITNEMRDEFFTKLIAKTKDLQNKYAKIVIAQTFIKEKYRKQLLDAIPGATFLLVTADTLLRENRLRQRTEYPLDVDYAREMEKNFDEPKTQYQILHNSIDGEENIKRQLQMLISQ